MLKKLPTFKKYYVHIYIVKTELIYVNFNVISANLQRCTTNSPISFSVSLFVLSTWGSHLLRILLLGRLPSGTKFILSKCNTTNQGISLYLASNTNEIYFTGLGANITSR